MSEATPTVMIVDDEVNITELFGVWLEADYDVRMANSGEEALAELDESVDVVLLDRRMPGLSGDEVLEEIRDRGYDCRVAMVTAVDPDFDVIEMGFDDYLTKPIDREGLESAIESLLDRKEYDDAMQEYYALTSKKAALESSKPASELEASEEYAELKAEIETLEGDLEGALETESDFESAFRDLD
ncbi:response regulator [Halodesulfurarchaeum sp. HSR-GB]|uniref:response regulator n=1 Tax=Halodesulfurarchaeum sp. HSR-GB TaxID=3074077 RepID=UPI002855805D|nr:response regulator [Halodesulfurarchaeum sp. HSR-GB]MDR5656666.1 response regulator [Halodesulfurarchaeum sp. HSR-GB]